MAPRSILRHHATFLALVAALTLSLGVGAAAADDSHRCYGVQGEAVSVFDPFAVGFVGEATFRLGGEEEQVTSSAFVTGPDSTMHVFEFSHGTLTTSDQLILVPTDQPWLFELRSRLTVIGGGSGKLHILPGSTLNLATGVAQWEMRGHVCFDA